VGVLHVFFRKYPAMDMHLLLPECHGSEVIQMVREVSGRQNEKRQWMVWIKHPATVYSNLKWCLGRMSAYNNQYDTEE